VSGPSQVAHFFEDPLPDFLPQSVFRHHVHLVVKPFFKELAQTDDIKKVSVLFKLNKDVDIAFRPLFTSRGGVGPKEVLDFPTKFLKFPAKNRLISPFSGSKLRV
jgi:hypothetical protein